MKRSNVIVALGLAVFLVGAAATYFVLKGEDSSQAAPAANRTTVLYAAKTIPAGTSGSTALKEGMVDTKTVNAASAPAGALTDPQELAGKTAANPIAEGSVITAEQFPQPQTGIGTLNIPPGMTALALQMEYPAGVAGFPRTGDKVDIYGVIKDPQAAQRVQLIMQNIEVLSVSTETAAAGQPVNANPIFLLAVTHPQAERLIFLTTHQGLYFSLGPRDEAPVPGTPGSGSADALKLLP